MHTRVWCEQGRIWHMTPHSRWIKKLKVACVLVLPHYMPADLWWQWKELRQVGHRISNLFKTSLDWLQSRNHWYLIPTCTSSRHWSQIPSVNEYPKLRFNHSQHVPSHRRTQGWWGGQRKIWHRTPTHGPLIPSVTEYPSLSFNHSQHVPSHRCT